MIKNYFKTAWRNILRTKGYSALNILGLSTGMAVALLIGLWVYDQYNFDRFLPDYGQLYQVRRNFNSNGTILNFTSTSLKLADALRTQIPEIEYVAETSGPQHHVLMVGEKKFYLEGLIIGNDFLNMFEYPLLEGNRHTAMKDSYSIVITQKTAQALFGRQDPIGKFLRLDNMDNLKVTGVLKNLPYNSSFQFDYLIPFSYAEQTMAWVKNAHSNGFDGNGFGEYVRLKAGIPYAQVAAKVKDIEKTEKQSQNAMLSDVVLQPLAHWHLYGNYINGKETGGFLEYVNMFTIIGALVLVIACINFINLTTARSEKRAREVGVRKAVGSMRQDLIIQFLSESLLLTAIAFLFSILLVQAALAQFNTLTKSEIVIPYGQPVFWVLMLGSVVLTALLAGSRPAFYLSSFQPARVLKGAMLVGKTASLPRKILVVAQFTCSVALIISTIIVYEQIQHARQRPTGYNIDRLMLTYFNQELDHHYAALKNDMLQQGICSSVTTASSPATDIYWHSNVQKWPGQQAGETVEMGTIIVGDDYFKTLGMPIALGRSYESPGDSTRVIFNQSAISRLRIKSPLDQVVTWDTARQIVGVAKDALMISPFSPADPTMFIYSATGGRNCLLYRLSPGIKTEDAVAKLNALFNKYNPSYPYEYTFSDENYARKYDLEMLVGKLAGIFAALAVFISCLGLFGLAAYIAEQRTREIGIRKILGASVSQVWLLLSRDFILLVGISCVIASPLAFYFLNHWLLQYDYRISIGVSVFLLAAAAALAITILTVSFQAIKAAWANPVDSLRTEG